MPGRVIVITGASQGIGAQLARTLVAKGDRVVLSARGREPLVEVARACGENACAVVGDMTRRADVERLRDESLARFGRIDAWVNNVGRGIGRRVLELTDDDVDEMVSVNLKSAIYGMQVAAAVFQAQGTGHLVNVSSNLGRFPVVTYRSAYSAMKSALNTLTANLRVDLARSHPQLQVSLVLPGPVATDFHSNALGGTPAPPPGAPPMAFQTAQEVADVIAHVLDHPRAEAYTSPALEETARRYMADVPAFEAAMLKPRAGSAA